MNGLQQTVDTEGSGEKKCRSIVLWVYSKWCVYINSCFMCLVECVFIQIDLCMSICVVENCRKYKPEYLMWLETLSRSVYNLLSGLSGHT